MSLGIPGNGTLVNFLMRFPIIIPSSIVLTTMLPQTITVDEIPAINSNIQIIAEIPKPPSLPRIIFNDILPILKKKPKG